jgi:PleD family two-component response regulator
MASSEQPDATDHESLLTNADHAMFLAKKKGRDRVIVHSPSGEPADSVEGG